MILKEIKNIVFIGSGNLSTNLAYELFNTGFCVKQVFSRTLENAKKLALKTNASFTNSISEIDRNADLYIISVTDSAIEDVAKQLRTNKGMVVHTSGSVSIDVLDAFADFGVFYPLQTFTKNKKVDFSKLPLLVEANNSGNNKLLSTLAASFTQNVYTINSEERLKVHLAAVFACNFTNLMYGLAEKILKDSNIPFEIIRPLIMETAQKIQHQLPSEVQTGPAVRNDLSVIEKHLSLLENEPDIREVYRILSNNIRLNQKNDKKL